MDPTFSNLFIDRWEKYFGGVSLPISFFYTDEVSEEDRKESTITDRCLIGNLKRVQEGFPFVYDQHTAGCPGGKRFTGFSNKLQPNFEYFLSYGIPGKLEGEHYKKSPELVKEWVESQTSFEAPAKYLVFKRLDKLSESELPFAVIFFASHDVLSGLFALANYDQSDPNGVIAPMGSGCSTIISYPLSEASTDHPRCVLGMFDVSARPCISANELTFSIPMKKFEQMVNNMDESFLTTHSWDLVKERIGKGQ